MRTPLLLSLCLTSAAAWSHEGSLPGTQVSALTLAADGLTPAPLIIPAPTGDLVALQQRMIAHQIQLLEFDRLSLAGPLGFTVFGGTSMLVGLAMTPFGYGFLAVGLVAASGGIVPLAIGLVWLFSNLAYNRRIDAAISRLHEEQRASPVSSALGRSREMDRVCSPEMTRPARREAPRS